MSEWTDIRDSGRLLIGHRYADGITWDYISSGLTEYGELRVFTPDIINYVFSTLGNDLRNVSGTTDVPIELLAASICLVAETAGASTPTYEQHLDGFESYETTPTLAIVGCTGLRYDRALTLSGVAMPEYVADPMTAINAAASHIIAAVPQTFYQPPIVASAYNTDGIRYDAASRWRIAPATQIDRFVGFFNSVVHALQMNPPLAGSAPNFTAELARLAAPAVPPIVTPPEQTFNKPESQAAADAGMMTLCEHNPSLSAIWALDRRTQTEISNVAIAAPTQGLPLGLDYFAYPDRGGMMRQMNSDEVQQLYRAMRDYIAAIMLYDTNRTDNLPGQPVFIP